MPLVLYAVYLQIFKIGSVSNSTGFDSHFGASYAAIAIQFTDLIPSPWDVYIVTSNLIILILLFAGYQVAMESFMDVVI